MIKVEQSTSNSAISTLGEYDVLCGRQKAAFNNTGNKRFRITVSLSLECFMKATSRKEKNTLIKSILKMVQSNGGRFLEFKNNEGLVELSTRKAHMKVGHALRDMALAARTSNGGKKGTLRRQQQHEPSFIVAPKVVSTNTPNDSNSSAIEDPLDIFYSISTDDIPEATTISQDTQTEDMLQWLVGESDGLLGDKPVDEEVPIPNHESYSTRSSIVFDDSMVQWLTGESDDVTFDDFQFVECI